MRPWKWIIRGSIRHVQDGIAVAGHPDVLSAKIFVRYVRVGDPLMQRYLYRTEGLARQTLQGGEHVSIAVVRPPFCVVALEGYLTRK